MTATLSACPQTPSAPSTLRCSGRRRRRALAEGRAEGRVARSAARARGAAAAARPRGGAGASARRCPSATWRASGWGRRCGAVSAVIAPSRTRRLRCGCTCWPAQSKERSGYCAAPGPLRPAGDHPSCENARLSAVCRAGLRGERTGNGCEIAVAGWRGWAVTPCALHHTSPTSRRQVPCRWRTLSFRRSNGHLHTQRVAPLMAERRENGCSICAQ
mmetsp:Transcript_51052/g.169121  ORF Transcript_51052/g.169121 Transcript_51052/m.169121 type:complete len:216 (+) Transcript_51052:651-1298(+)